jgi:co-chaperonin GroES (HSP10)
MDVFSPVHILDVKDESNVVLIAQSNNENLEKGEIVAIGEELDRKKNYNLNFSIADTLSFGFHCTKQTTLIDTLRIWTST